MVLAYRVNNYFKLILQDYASLIFFKELSHLFNRLTSSISLITKSSRYWEDFVDFGYMQMNPHSDIFTFSALPTVFCLAL